MTLIFHTLPRYEFLAFYGATWHLLVATAAMIALAQLISLIFPLK